MYGSGDKEARFRVLLSEISIYKHTFPFKPEKSFHYNIENFMNHLKS